jgi:hypothetical protein
MTELSDENEAEEIVLDTFLPEDIPFDSDTEKTNSIGSMHKGVENLPKETPAKNWDESRKFALGSSMLGWCLFLMLICILLSLWKPDNELVKSGFEAFKLIVMTILGYLFGSNNSKLD